MELQPPRDSPLHPAPMPDAGAPALGDYLVLARRRWWLILAGALVGISAMWFVERGRPDEYTARVLLQKKEQVSPLEAMNAEAGGPPPPDMASQVEILRSQTLLAAVVDSVRLRLTLSPPTRRDAVFSDLQVEQGAPAASYQLERGESGLVLLAADGSRLASADPGGWLAGPGFRLRVAPDPRLSQPEALIVQAGEDAVSGLRSALRVEQPLNTNLLRVSYTDPDPVQTAAVANAVATVYQAQSDARARAAATRKREFLAGQLAAQADSLAAAQRATADYQEQAHLLDPTSEGQTLANALFQVEGEARGLRFQESVLRSVLTSLRGNATDDDGLSRMVALSDSLVPNGAGLYTRLQNLQAERASLTASRYGYTARGPRVEVLDSLIRDTRNEMRAVVRQSLSLLGKRRQDADARVAELKARVGALPARATVFDRLAQNADNLQKTFDLLAGKYYEAQVAEATASGDVAILDRASVPTHPDPSHRRRDLVLGLIMGLLGGLGVAVLLERLDTSIRHRGDAERATGLEVLGMVPRLEVSANGSGPITDGPHQLDPFRTLRVALRFARAEQPTVLTVTSQGPTEGKSFTAAHLALVLAEKGARVLLVDGDLRRPTLHERFSVPRTPGLSDVLVGEAAPGDATHRLESGVYLMPAGTIPPDPGHLIDGDSMQKLLGFGREEFDLLVLDSPPVLAASESLVLCGASEGVLVVVQPYQTRAPGLAEAIRRLRQVGAPLLGVVLNRVPAGMGGYGSYYHYYEYGKYYHRDGRKRKRRKVIAGGRNGRA